MEKRIFDISNVDIDELKIFRKVSFGKKKELNILLNTEMIKKLGNCV